MRDFPLSLSPDDQIVNFVNAGAANIEAVSQTLLSVISPLMSILNTSATLYSDRDSTIKEVQMVNDEDISTFREACLYAFRIELHVVVK